MDQWIAIVAYRCEIAGRRADLIDIQVRYFTAGSADEVESRLRSEPVHSYENSDGQLVAWPFVDVLAIESLARDPQEGSELIGFVADGHAFAK